MDSHGIFSFLIILQKSFQLVPKNGKLMALVTIFSLLLSTITYAAFTFSVHSLSMDMASTAKAHTTSDPRSFPPDVSKLQHQLDHMKQILAIMYAVEIASIFIFFVISFFTTMATVIVSAVSHDGNTFSLKDLLARIAGTWKRPLLTSVYVSAHALGFLAIPELFAIPAFIYPNVFAILLAVSFAIVVFLFYLYLQVIWSLAVVVSVVEEGYYGMEAMGKASRLVKGQRLKGYMLNLTFFLASSVMLVIYLVIFRIKGPARSRIYGFFVVGLSCLVKICQVVAYTVLYFDSKKQHGENPEVDIGVVKYLSLPTTYP
ncbi:hypothetical protein F511_02517 [Dorcoceras hygrometricum]|nr:hypothetical protein F511_02517 [Dorcoceras hygrometricum]